MLGTTIDKYCYIFVRKLPPFFSHKHRVVYSQIELVRDHRELVHPAVRAALMEFTSECPDGIEIQHMGDLPLSWPPAFWLRSACPRVTGYRCGRQVPAPSGPGPGGMRA